MGDIAIIIGGRESGNLSDIVNGTNELHLQISTFNPNTSTTLSPLEEEAENNLGFNIGVGVGAILAVILILAAFRGILLHKIIHSRAYRHLKRRLNRSDSSYQTKYGYRNGGNLSSAIPVLSDSDFSQLRELTQDKDTVLVNNDPTPSTLDSSSLNSTLASSTQPKKDEITVMELSSETLPNGVTLNGRKMDGTIPRPPTIPLTPANEEILTNGRKSPHPPQRYVGTIELNRVDSSAKKKFTSSFKNGALPMLNKGRHVTKVRVLNNPNYSPGEAVTRF